jgi:hypothetical protein
MSLPFFATWRDPRMLASRLFYRSERRTFCSCELCRLRFGRMLYPRRGGDPIRTYRRRP